MGTYLVDTFPYIYIYIDACLPTVSNKKWIALGKFVPVNRGWVILWHVCYTPSTVYIYICLGVGESTVAVVGCGAMAETVDVALHTRGYITWLEWAARFEVPAYTI